MSGGCAKYLGPGLAQRRIDLCHPYMAAERSQAGDAVLADPEVRAAGLIVVCGDPAAGPQPVQVLDRLAGRMTAGAYLIVARKRVFSLTPLRKRRAVRQRAFSGVAKPTTRGMS